MPTTPKVRITDYYETVPGKEHKTGDVWSGLPLFGALGKQFGFGLVITPACDLSNRKVETITYVPIISVNRYMLSPAFLPEIYREILRTLSPLGLQEHLKIGDEFSPLNTEKISNLRGILDGESIKNKSTPNKTALIARASSGLDHIQSMGESHNGSSNANLHLRNLFGEKQLGEIYGKIVRNSYKSDIHFLPCDGQPLEWSGVVSHSVALFRYPFAVSCAALDITQNTDCANWKEDVNNHSLRISCINPFGDERPLKRLSVKPRFIADLITRFVGVHIRLGAPSFSILTVQDYVNDLIKP